MDVAVVGAGLAGLAAAIELRGAGHAIQVFEAGDRAGGRVATDEVEGHLLDRGFQVLLDAYPEVWNLLDVAPLDLRYFAPGALIRLDGGFHRVTDPLQDPSGLLATLRSPVGSLGDKLRILSFRRAVRKGTLDDLWNRPERTALERLREANFSDDMIENLLRPLFTGITLDPELSGSSRVLEFVFRMLSSGHTGVPARGMAAIPAQLAARLPSDAVALSTPVAAVDASPTGAAVTLTDGEVVSADAVIIATDATSAAELADVTDHGWRATTTVWFAADEPPVADPILVLNGEGSGPINSLAVMSQVSPEYAPTGRSTIAVSAPVIESGLADAFRAQLGDWFGADVDGWEVLRVDEISEAHPIQPPGHDRSGVTGLGGATGGRVLICGDHRADPSINGALFSGRAAARTLLAELDRAGPRPTSASADDATDGGEASEADAPADDGTNGDEASGADAPADDGTNRGDETTGADAPADDGDDATTGADPPTDDGDDATTGADPPTDDGDDATTGADPPTDDADDATTGADPPTDDGDDATTGADPPTDDGDDGTTGADPPTDDAANDDAATSGDEATASHAPTSGDEERDAGS